jgi:hypothetical protein
MVSSAKMIESTFKLLMRHMIGGCGCSLSHFFKASIRDSIVGQARMTGSSGEENPMIEEVLQRPCRRICYHQHPTTCEKTIPVHAVWNNFGEFYRVPL